MSISSDCSSQVRFPLPACSHNHDHLSGNDKEVQIYSQITTHSVCFSTCSPIPQENSQNESEKKYSNTIPHSTITIIMISPSIAINIILLGCCLFTIIKPSFPYTLLAGSPSIFGGLSSSLGEGNGASHRNALPGLTWLAGSNQSSSWRRDATNMEKKTKTDQAINDSTRGEFLSNLLVGDHSRSQRLIFVLNDRRIASEQV